MTERKPMIAGNWKMFKTLPQALGTARELVDLLKKPPVADVMIAPAHVFLQPLFTVFESTYVALGAQNVFWENEGAFTGEISPPMLTSVGCKYVIIGHSERRQFLSETNENIRKKIKAAIDSRLIPIFCVGETEAERDAEKTFSVLDKQVRKGIEKFSRDELKDLVIAYEPVWAIGTGKTATKKQAQEIHAFIRSLIEKIYGNDLAKKMRILYGGSVKPTNIADLMGMDDIDGALIGGASLEADTFSKIVYY